MEDLTTDLEKKRNRLNRVVEEHKYKRDRLNAETKRHVEERNRLNKKVKKIIEEATKHKDIRDQLNEQVQKAKELRDFLNNRALELSEQLTQLKRQQIPKKGPPLEKLKKELRKMEFKQMTTVFSSEKERDFIEKLHEQQNLINEREAQEMTDEIRNAMSASNEARDKAEEQHKELSRLADKAQKEHDIMSELFRDADVLRKQADDAQEKLIATKLKADEEHRKCIDNVEQIHDFDKIISGLRQKEYAAHKTQSESAMIKESEEIFERFKKGEKLSTEDLMTLQRAGLL